MSFMDVVMVLQLKFVSPGKLEGDKFVSPAKLDAARTQAKYEMEKLYFAFLVLDCKACNYFICDNYKSLSISILDALQTIQYRANAI